ELGGYSSDISMRSAVPEQELISLDNYRLRHSHYKLDPDLRALHQQYAFLSIWDDHESSDNAYKDGAYNHQANEGSWQERKAAAVKAYMEWMPVRENPEFDQRIYRKFSYGKLVDLYMLDTRLEGRDEQVAIGSPDISSAERRLLGDEQFNWLRQEMLSSKAQWKVLAQQVMMAPLRIGGLSINTDQWDGYTFERDRLFAFWQKEKMENLVVLTGDIHSSWASDLPTKAYNPVKDTGSVGVEFVCTSVTSPGMEIPVAEQALLLNNPHLKFSNLSKRGYMVLVIDSLRAQAEWYFSETVLEKNSRHQFGKAFYAEKGKPFLKESKRESIPKASQIALAPNEPQGGFSNLEEEYVFTVFGLYPNPFSSSFQMQFFSSTSTPAVLRMYSDNGAEIKRIKIAPHIGVNYLEVKTQELPSGFYTISLEIAGEIKGYSLIKK
ncbi:MAG: alkaline phosphatase D family protein, partial [Luteibaculum sp.]